MTTQLAVRELAEEEAIIARNLQGFVNAGGALQRIRDKGLYTAKYDTFDAYCKARWGWGRQHSYELIAAADIVEDLRVRHGVHQLPSNERQARPLTRIEDSDERAAAWSLALERAEDRNGEKVVTAAIVEDVVAEILDDPPPVEVHTKNSKDPRSQLLRDAARPIREAKKLSPAGFEEGEMNVLLKIIQRLIKRLENVDGDYPTT